ncbi:MAG: hypothetical protein QM734_02950 [Cyclobacteriaceae bacterium]
MFDPYLLKAYAATIRPVLKEVLQEILAEQGLTISSVEPGKNPEDIIDTAEAMKILGLKDRHSVYALRENRELYAADDLGKGLKFLRGDVVELAKKRIRKNKIKN